ncbi:hypothetical protein HUG15_20075 [Salicibibacter cibarius]|uniref:DUF2339 domain-containing protein n=1 Tax=Salicibibacter cibarius TaxID=2743000 RepID=A0A7T6Z621_9BACI|nr:brain acid soluble protein 1 [Salicibibacter cibarius]QQK77653.1 hypothetical protein HUG15_20075 [Salicibibacter cibarius]
MDNETNNRLERMKIAREEIRRLVNEGRLNAFVEKAILDVIEAELKGLKREAEAECARTEPKEEPAIEQQPAVEPSKPKAKKDEQPAEQSKPMEEKQEPSEAEQPKLKEDQEKPAIEPSGEKVEEQPPVEESKPKVETHPQPVAEPPPKPKEPKQEPPAVAKPQPQAAAKKERSPEEQRERRLTYILSSGVTLLLLGGVLLALTNWLMLADVTKVFLISGIAVLFGGMSFLAHKLQIKQTMLAFLLLFAFFVPIVFFSISFYGVFGTYLSAEGEGSTLFAAVAALLCVGLYAVLHHFNKHRAFQLSTVAAVSISALFAAAFAAASVEMYVFILAGLIFVQLLGWNRFQRSTWVADYRSLLPGFVFGQLLLVTFIQFILFSETMFTFVNLAVLGALFYLLARKKRQFQGSAIPGVLLFTIGVTGAIVVEFTTISTIAALLVLIVPTVLLSVYQWERSNDAQPLLYMPLRVLFYITLAGTHLYGQAMMFGNFGDVALYPVTFAWLSALFVFHGWQEKEQVTLFFSYLISLYSAFIIIDFWLVGLPAITALFVSLLTVVYVVTLRKQIDVNLIKRPLKLATVIMFGLVVLMLIGEWALQASVFALIYVITALSCSYEEKKYRNASGIVGASALFLALCAAFPALLEDTAIYTSLMQAAHHFLLAAAVLTAMTYVFTRQYGQEIARIPFIMAGALYTISLLYLLGEFPLFAYFWPTVHAIAGAGYLWIAVRFFFRNKELWWGVTSFSVLAYLSLLDYPVSDSPIVFWGLLLLAGGVFTWSGRGLSRLYGYGGQCFYIAGLGMIALFPLLYVMISGLSIHGLLVPLIILLAEVLMEKRTGWRVGQSLTLIVFLLLHNLNWFHALPGVTTVDGLLLTGGLITAAAFWRPLSFNGYGHLAGMIVLNLYLIALPLTEAAAYDWGHIAISFAIAAGTVYVLEKWKRGSYSAIPLSLTGLVILFSSLELVTSIFLLFLVAVLALAVGVYYFGWSLYERERINVYQSVSIIFALIAGLMFQMYTAVSMETTIIFSAVLFAYLFLLFVKGKGELERYFLAAYLLYYNFHWFSDLPVVTAADSLLLTGGIIAASAIKKPFSFKAFGYLGAMIAFNLYLLILPLTEAGDYGGGRLVIALAIVALTVYVLEKDKQGVYSAAPLALIGIVMIASSLEFFTTAVLLFLVALATLALGVYSIGWSMLEQKRINHYQLMSIVFVVIAGIVARFDPATLTAAEISFSLVLFGYLFLLFVKEKDLWVRTVLAVFLLLYNMNWFNDLTGLTVSDSLLLTGAIIAATAFKQSFQYQSFGYFGGMIVFNLYLLILPVAESGAYGWGRMAIAFAIAAGTVYVLEKWTQGACNAIPLSLTGIVIVASSLELIATVSMLFFVALATLSVGVYYIGWSLFERERVNLYQLVSIGFIFIAGFLLVSDQAVATGVELIFATVLFAYFALLFIKEKGASERSFKAIALLISYYYPLALLLRLLPLATEFHIYAYVVSFMVLVSVLLRHVAYEANWKPYVEMAVVIIGFVTMSVSTLAEQTLYTSLTMSVLAVLAVLVGFYLKYAVYFLTGIVVLLVNTLYATRAFWASVPWWMYIMAVGAALIAFATYQELKKREGATTTREQWQRMVQKVKRMFQEWK